MKHTPKPKRIASLEQIAVNRANAAHSTGPRTPQGKANSAQNARRHGFTGSSFSVVRLEDLHQIADLRADLLAAYLPVNSQELFALERMAIAQQTILRAARFESGLFTTCLNETLDPDNRPFRPMSQDLAGDGDIEITRAQNRNFALAEGFHRLNRKSNSCSLFLRYQAQAERLYRRAVEEFNRVKTLRDEIPNEPNCGLEPEQNPTTYPPPESNPIPSQDAPSPDVLRPVAVPPLTVELSANPPAPEVRQVAVLGPSLAAPRPRGSAN
jgi:hypothetical protein